MPTPPQHQLARLRAAADLLGTHQSPAQRSDDPRAQQVLLSARLLAAAEHQLLQAGQNTHRGALADAIQTAAEAMATLPDDDPLRLLVYLAWRFERDACLATGLALPDGAHDQQVCAIAVSAAQATAQLLALLQGRAHVWATPDKDPDVPEAVSLVTAREALRTAWLGMVELDDHHDPATRSQHPAAAARPLLTPHVRSGSGRFR